MTRSVFDLTRLGEFDVDRFRAATPFPWHTFDGLVPDAAFARLVDTFPAAELFETHRGIPRLHGQRPHDRLYLAYESSLYHRDEPTRTGVIHQAQLAPEWQDFVGELQHGRAYLDLLSDAVATREFSLRFAWHIGSAGNEVSAHVDAEEKLGTHIFYFNAPGEWNGAWGGQTCLLGGRRTPSMAPEFDDFDQMVSVDQVPNRSLLMRNSAEAWHGVAPLRCPPGHPRRLFNVIIEPRGVRAGAERPSTRRKILPGRRHRKRTV